MKNPPTRGPGNTEQSDNVSNDTEAGQLRQAVVVPSASIRIKCKVCGWISTGRVPNGGDGSSRLPKKHTRGIDGVYCKGIYEEGEWL